MIFTEDKTIEETILKALVMPKKTDEMIAHYPSGLMSCPRSRYYSWMSREELEKEFGELEKTAIDEEWITKTGIFAMGNAVEDQLKALLNMAGLLPSPDRCQYRIRSRTFLISGNIDFLIWHEGKNIPIECKSAKKERFYSVRGWVCNNCKGKLKKTAKVCPDCDTPFPEKTYITEKVGYEEQPSIDHYAQLQSYLNIGNFEYGYLYYYNKNDSTRKWWRIDKDPEFWHEIILQNEKLLISVDAREVPERPYKADFDINGCMKRSSDWQCRYCDWSRICWSDVIRENLTECESQVSRMFGV